MNIDATQSVRLEGELTIYTASTLRDYLLQELTHLNGRGGADISLDLSAVTEVDSAGLQLVLAAQRYVSDAGRTLRIVSPAPAFIQAANLLKLDGLLGLVRL